MREDIGTLLAAAPMRRLQIMVVALCIALNALDGFDVLAISFAAPGIAQEWGMDKAALGIVLSMELFGMAAGSVLIGNLADRIGRRPVILGCLTVMAAGMFCATAANGLVMLCVTRVITGLGIGGMIACTSAMVAEYSNDRRRNLNVALNIAGYSTGAILGGLAAAALLEAGHSWRALFHFGGIVTLVALPLAFFLLPESIGSLLARRPAGALERINTILARLRHAPLDELPAPAAKVERPSFRTLLSGEYGRATLLLTVAYFAQIMLFYYVVKWIPKIVVDMGFDAASASRVLVGANIGNLSGAILIGIAAQRFSVRPLVIGAMLLGFVVISLFGLGSGDLTRLTVIAGVAAFFINAGVVGLYPILAGTYPAALRASGTGFVIGMGRGGSALGPVVAGALFAGGGSLLTVSMTMGAGALIAAAMLFLLPAVREQEQPAG
ncbi:MFS transporter [Sphingomonas sp. Root710]|uniref:MFS transporter n=1 Tax=Sphingomonas sp. Root710 TaxID=1736594 RepID=UPI000701A222|nr:MFS transporter [Sphingomonas sp. Root710]KRB86165.1 MFS transporter [Sphingomonas sp. Root710]